MMLRFISLFVLSEHCVQDGQQFTHTVNQRHFFGFSGCWQMHVKRLFHRIKRVTTSAAMCRAALASVRALASFGQQICVG